MVIKEINIFLPLHTFYTRQSLDIDVSFCLPLLIISRLPWRTMMIFFVLAYYMHPGEQKYTHVILFTRLSLDIDVSFCLHFLIISRLPWRTMMISFVLAYYMHPGEQKYIHVILFALNVFSCSI